MQTHTRRQTLAPAHQPDQPHSGLKELSRAQPPSLEGGLETEPCSTQHATRETNLSCLKREKEQDIQFPSSGDKQWEKVNEELEIAIPQVFSKTKMSRLDVSTLSNRFLKWIHAFFKEKFGVKDNTSGKKEARRKPRVHQGLANLRKQKRNLNKAKKTLLKAGHAKNSKAMVSLSRSWRKVMKQHNRLRLAVKKMHDQRSRRAAENAFKKDPKKFADKLFHGPGHSAAPTFSKEKLSGILWQNLP